MIFNTAQKQKQIHKKMLLNAAINALSHKNFRTHFLIVAYGSCYFCCFFACARTTAPTQAVELTPPLTAANDSCKSLRIPCIFNSILLCLISTANKLKLIGLLPLVSGQVASTVW